MYHNEDKNKEFFSCGERWRDQKPCMKRGNEDNEILSREWERKEDGLVELNGTKEMNWGQQNGKDDGV